MAEIKRRERDAVLQSLQAGLVPRVGLHLIQVGRKDEVSAVLNDLERIEQGGAAFRIVMGRFGSGKSFFLNLVRTLALQKRMVVVQADMSMERRIHASGGQARALFSELMKNLATKAKPDGGALRNLCEGWISGIQNQVKASGGSDEEVKRRIFEDLRELQDCVGGFEFAEVLSKYYDGHVTGSDALQGAALRWLRGEYTTKTDARTDLGVRRIIGDENFYDSLKLVAAFSVKAGYTALLVNMDEMVVLSHRLPSARARQTNYEALLTLLNDCLQGTVRNLGFLLAGTDEFVEDKRRGLYSYEALRSRLAENRFAGQGVKDFSGPVLRLQNLSAEDLFVLLRNIRHVHAFGDETKYIVPDEALVAVLKKASETLGADYYKTPRDIVRSFVGLLSVLEQNPGRDWRSFLGDDFVAKPDKPASAEEEIAKGAPPPEDAEHGLETFKL
ncbi:MAG: ATP-binding protein [Verrucomicrobia bacterium]|nr:ATP-binding protein [Verrucomicrobiota bacterium]